MDGHTMNTMRFHRTKRGTCSFFKRWHFIIPLILLAVPLCGGVNKWTFLGPDGGSVLSLAIDARDHSIIYAGTRESGVGGASLYSAILNRIKIN
jgi:hypothetical protein